LYCLLHAHICSGCLIAGAADFSESTAEPYQVDDIRTEYHPHSNLLTKVEHFDDYNHCEDARPSPLRDEEPWRPFRTCIDFEFAKLVLQAALSHDLADSLIKLVHHSVTEKGSFTLENHTDMQNMWDKASAKLTAVSFLSFIYVAVAYSCSLEL
jgi:hypothetical protein